MKTLAIILGTIVASVVLTIAVLAIVMYVTAEPDEFSRASVIHFVSEKTSFIC